MKGISIIFSLIMLHQLDHTVIWVETAYMQIIKDKAGCDHKSGSVIRVGGTQICVIETADEIREKIKQVGGK